jgi:hypothetical protein
LIEFGATETITVADVDDDSVTAAGVGRDVGEASDVGVV